MTAALALLLAAASPSPEFTALLRRFVETDTTLATGSCTAAAEVAADAMRRGGVPAKAIVPFSEPGHPKEGGLLARIDGSDRASKPLLLVAHIDTVPADPADWTHPPFRLTESQGYLYGRGVADNKVVAALLVEMMIDLHQAGAPKRGIAIALTCGEETPAAFNGAAWLAAKGRAAIDPAMVLIPSGGATLDAAGNPRSMTIAIAEKAQQNFRLEARGKGSHASQPHPDNAIVHLTEAVSRVARHKFPVTLSATVRAQLERTSADAAGALAILNFLENPQDAAAQDRIAANPAWNGLVRTTCVTTIIDTGRQANTISPSASANVNCRLLPGATVPDVQTKLETLVAGLPVTVRPIAPLAAPAANPPYPSELIAAAHETGKTLWPGLTVTSAMLTGATDARHFNAAGVPAYGITILPFESDGSRVHAPDERVLIRSVGQARAFLRALVGRLAHQNEF